MFAPATIDIVAPGFGEANRALYLDLFRLMLVTPIIFAASIALGEIHVAERRFLFYALAPILYNAGIAGGAVLLHDQLGIRAAAVGAVIGALLHLSVRLVGMTRSTIRVRPRLDLRTPALREFLRLMGPKMISHPVEPLTFLFFNNVASSLAAGSVTALSFARNFQSVPVSLVGVAIALAAFPLLSAAWAAGDTAGFRRQVRSAAGRAGLARAVPFEALGHLFARGLYATHNTVLPVLASLAGFALTVSVTLVLVEPIGVIAIPLGFTAGAALRAGLQGLLLARRIRGRDPVGVAG